MKCLVTGATGFLGSRIIRALLRDGHQVAILKRTTSDIWRLKDLISSLSVFDLDRTGFEVPFATGKPYDTLIHCSTCYGRKGESLSDIYKANVLLPLRLLDLGRKAGLSSFVNTDTILPRETSLYALSKSHFVEALKRYSETESFPVANLKLDHFYGPEDDKSKFTSFIILKCLSNEANIDLTFGEQKRDFLYIDDIVEAYRSILNSNRLKDPVFKSYEIGTGSPVTLRFFVEAVHALTRSKSRLNFGAIPYRDNEPMESTIDLKAISQLGWYPKISLEEGILSTIEYFSNE